MTTNAPIVISAPPMLTMPLPDLSGLVAPMAWNVLPSGELMLSMTSHPNPVPCALDHAATLAAYNSAWSALAATYSAAVEAVIAAHTASQTQPLASDWPVPPAPPELAPVWIVPTSATMLAPPTPVAGQWPVLTNGAWTMVEDHRGTNGWDANGNAMMIHTLGPMPAGFVTVAPAAVTAATLASAKAVALAGVIAYADALDAQVTANYPKAEQKLWPTQYAEAVAVTANTAALTPTLAKIAASMANNAPVPTAAQIAAVTPAQISTLAAMVLAKAAALEAVSVAVGYMRANAQAGIALAPDMATLATTVTALEASAAAAKTALGL
ncbi:MAG: hypothetical protein KGQ46_12490 [Hyphomicrobiales bacterium]|nr:hypothetical protein [Hyphomicrobiales bacterium]MDE2113821.1 hypothetical protein [Hyphomicrobiales bacterium]